MNEYYLKRGKKYIPVGYGDVPDIHEGIWLVKCSDGSKSFNNLVYRISDLPQPLDMQKVTSLLIYEDSLTKFFAEYFDDGNENGSGIFGDSPEEAKLYNVSVSKLSLDVLRFLFQECERLKKKEENK